MIYTYSGELDTTRDERGNHVEERASSLLHALPLFWTMGEFPPRFFFSIFPPAYHFLSNRVLFCLSYTKGGFRGEVAEGTWRNYEARNLQYRDESSDAVVLSIFPLFTATTMFRGVGE